MNIKAKNKIMKIFSKFDFQSSLNQLGSRKKSIHWNIVMIGERLIECCTYCIHLWFVPTFFLFSFFFLSGNLFVVDHFEHNAVLNQHKLKSKTFGFFSSLYGTNQRSFTVLTVDPNNDFIFYLLLSFNDMICEHWMKCNIIIKCTNLE